MPINQEPCHCGGSPSSFVGHSKAYPNNCARCGGLITQEQADFRAFKRFVEIPLIPIQQS